MGWQSRQQIVAFPESDFDRIGQDHVLATDVSGDQFELSCNRPARLQDRWLIDGRWPNGVDVDGGGAVSFRRDACQTSRGESPHGSRVITEDEARESHKQGLDQSSP